MNAVHDLSLSHFSSKRLEIVGERTQERAGWRPKPSGLWVSVDGEDDWESWCTSENFGMDRLAIRHRVTLAPAANVLLITGAAELDAFNTKYRDNQQDRPLRGSSIAWECVAEKHDGIIIAPYVWTRRLDGPCGWYYGWDCASGCIWHPRAIASVEIIADLLRESDPSPDAPACARAA